MSTALAPIIAAFRVSSMAHYEASLNGDYQRANAEAEKIHALVEEFRKAGDTGREALFRLSESEFLPEACMAASYSLGYRPDQCEKVLSRIARSRELIGLKAKYALKNWQSGSWKLGE